MIGRSKKARILGDGQWVLGDAKRVERDEVLWKFVFVSAGVKCSVAAHQERPDVNRNHRRLDIETVAAFGFVGGHLEAVSEMTHAGR